MSKKPAQKTKTPPAKKPALTEKEPFQIIATFTPTGGTVKIPATVCPECMLRISAVINAAAATLRDAGLLGGCD